MMISKNLSRKKNQEQIELRESLLDKHGAEWKLSNQTYQEKNGTYQNYEDRDYYGIGSGKLIDGEEEIIDPDGDVTMDLDGTMI